MTTIAEKKLAVELECAREYTQAIGRKARADSDENKEAKALELLGHIEKAEVLALEIANG